MINLEIRNAFSSDVEYNSWMPKDKSGVYFSLHLDIGEKNRRGADVFQVVIATPEGILSFNNRHPSEVIFTRGHIVLRQFKWKTVNEKIHEIVKICEAETWDLCVHNLRRFFVWEYDRELKFM